MNERDVKLAAMINEMFDAAHSAGYFLAAWENGPVSTEIMEETKYKAEDLKKKLFEALNIRIV
jgi:hypothetical protein